MAALWGGARPAGARGTRRRGRGEGSGPELPLPPCAPPQCFSLEEDEPGLHLASLQAGTILEAEEILGTMQSYLDSSMISVIEDFSSLNESKACLDVPNELSLLTAITEILDSTDDETLSPFDTTMDSELLALPRERESSSFQKFLSLSRPSPERSVPALDDPWGPSCTAAAGKAETGSVDLPCDRPLSCLEDPATPKKPPSRAHRAERQLARPPQRSDGEEEEAASPGQPGRVAAAGHLAQSAVGFCAAAVSQEDGAELEAGWPEDSDIPCIIHTGGVSLSELVRSMHPYCLPTLTVCLDPACEPVAQDFLTGPLMLEIMPGEGEGLEIPVVLQQLGPGAQLSAEEEGASGCPAGKGAGGLEPLPTEGVVPEGWLGTPAQGHEAEGPGSAPQEEPPRPPQARERDPGAQDEARKGDHRPESSSRRSTEAPAGGKRQGTEKGRGRERARKSRKKKREGSQKGQAEPDGDAMVHRLRSASSVQPPAPQRSPTWTAHPSVQVSTFLEKQLEQAKKEGQMELRSSRAPRARGRPRAAAPGGSLQRKAHPEPPGPPAPAVPSSEEQPADVGPGPAEQGEGAAGCGEGSWPAPPQGSTSPEAAPPPGCGVPRAEREDVERAGAETGAWPPREAKPKALSLREYRLRMLRRQPGGADRKDAERPAASKWPSVPEPPTELAEIPCLLAPVRPPPSQPAQPVETPSSPKPSSPPATPPPASKAPAGAPQTVPVPVPPGLQLPFLPPAMGAAPAGIPLPSASPYTLYPPVPSWPCFGPPPAGYPGLPPPPGAVPGGSPNAFHVVPGLPPPALAWPSPSLPPPSFGPGVPCAPMGWALGLQPSYWPGVPLPPPAPPVVYGEAGAALQSPGVQPFPASPLPEGAGAHRPEALVRRAACAHSLAPAAPALSCQEPSVSTAQPTRPLATAAGQATAASKHRDPAQPPQRRVQPSARAAAGRAADPRRQSRPVEESPIGQPPSAAATTQPVGEPVSTAAPQPTGEPPAPQPTGEPTAPRPVGEPAAQPTGEPSVATTWPIREPPDICPTAEAAAPAKVPVPSLLQGAQPDPKGAAPQEPQLPGPTPALGKAAPPRARAENQPAKPAPTRPWRHQPLVSPAQPAGGKDIVQAFISEMGIEASDLSSLLEQFEKSEAKKEELRVRRPGDRPAAGNAGSEGHQDKTPLDSLHAPELANVAGLTPPATPPHQLWKPLAAVSLLAKPRSPGAAPREGSQRSAKFIEAKPLPQSKPRGKGPPPSHVGSGDHDYCARGTAQPEEAARLPGAPAPSELGSRWNVKHHQDITIKPLSSLPTRTLGRPGLSPPPAPAPGSSEQLDHRTSARSRAAAVRSSPPTSVLLSPDASPCRDEEPRTRDPPPKHSAAKRSLRCYRRRGASPSPRASRAHASRSFSSTSNGTSTSSSSSSSSSRSRSRSRSQSLSPPPKRWRRYRSRRSRSAHSSRSSCGSCGRSRRSLSSSSSYSSRSSSSSRSRSRSPSPHRPRTRRRRYDYCDPPDHCQRQKVLHKERAIEERRVVFVGKIPSRMTRAELRHRFAVFGDIEECTLHFRAEGDNYGFVTYRYAQEAFAAIESGHKLRRPDEQPFDLCFGGRRQFCRRNYADLDSNREEFDPAPVKSKFDSLDFDTLLKQAQRSLRR